MSIIQTLNFNDSINFNLTDTEISGSTARLALINIPNQTFTENFADDTDFTYDNTKAEFTGGLLRQKDLRPVDSVVAATYTSSKDLSWSQGGSLTGTDTGTPVLNAGKLECHGYVNYSVRYTNSEIGNTGDTGAAKVRYTPNYSGTPSQNINIIEFAPTSGNADKMLFFHSSTGTLRLTAYTSAGTVKHSAAAFSVTPWSPTAGVEYEIELNWDTVAGTVRLFIDGVLYGSMPVSSYARSTTATTMYVGAGIVYTVANAAFNDVVIFNTVQHTSGYTAGYTIPEYTYSESIIDLPIFSHVGVGYIVALTNLSVTEVSSPRYTIEGKYWNGSAWVASNGTYAQASSLSTVNTNIASLVLTSQTAISVSVVFQSSNTLTSVDNLILTHTHEAYSLSGYIEPSIPIQTQEVISLSQVHSDTANSSIQVAISVDGVLKYWNGSAWANSNGSFAQTNTVAQVNTNIGSLDFSSNSSVFFRWVFQTSDNTESATITSAEIEYDFGAVETDPTTCLVYGYYRDVGGNPVNNAAIEFSLFKKTGRYVEANNNIIDRRVTVKTDINGYFEADLIRTSEYDDGGMYLISIENESGLMQTLKSRLGNDIKFSVPDLTTRDITDILDGTT